MVDLRALALRALGRGSKNPRRFIVVVGRWKTLALPMLIIKQSLGNLVSDAKK